jgi:CO/xanthine dehydrogenase Mo-binding subunit
LEKLAGLLTRASRGLEATASAYLIPVHADMPRFDVHLVPEHNLHLASGNALGKGLACNSSNRSKGTQLQ